MRYLLPILLLVLCLAACVDPPCVREKIDVKYTFHTSCTGVSSQSNGEIALSLSQAGRYEGEISRLLSEQAQQPGLSVKEVFLRWEANTCEDRTTPLKVLGVERIVLEPESVDSSVQLLLVCTPISSDDNGLQKEMLLACRKGTQKQTHCSMTLNPVL